jgi:hypothetical protein
LNKSPGEKPWRAYLLAIQIEELTFLRKMARQEVWWRLPAPQTLREKLWRAYLLERYVEARDHARLIEAGTWTFKKNQKMQVKEFTFSRHFENVNQTLYGQSSRRYI